MSKPLIFWPNRKTPSWSFFLMEGADARDFVQRLSSVETRNLEVGGSEKQGLFLTPQGKIRSLFRIRRLAENRLGFELDPGPNAEWKTEFKNYIELYTFQEKFELSEPYSDNPSACCWVFGESELSMPASTADVAVFDHGTKDFGRHWWSLWGDAQKITSLIASFSADEIQEPTLLEDWQIQSMTPWTGKEILLESNPLELGLGSAIADQKGCYPGQEVIEKIVSLGSPAKRLCLISSNETATQLAAGENLLDSENASLAVGQITRAGAGNHALALIRKTHAQPGKILSNPAGARIKIEQVSGYALAENSD